MNHPGKIVHVLKRGKIGREVEAGGLLELHPDLLEGVTRQVSDSTDQTPIPGRLEKFESELARIGSQGHQRVGDQFGWIVEMRGICRVIEEVQRLVSVPEQLAAEIVRELVTERRGDRDRSVRGVDEDQRALEGPRILVRVKA